MEIINGRVNSDGQDSPAKSNYFTTLLSSQRLHILCVSDIETNHNYSRELNSADSVVGPSTSSVSSTTSPKVDSTFTPLRSSRYGNMISAGMDAMRNFSWKKVTRSN